MAVPVLAGLRADGAPDLAVAERVARAWLSGGLIGLPTETVYGLAADAQDPVAVERIYAAKGRPADHPLIVHVAGADAIDGWSAAANRWAHALAEAFWPGPLTVVVRRSARAADFLTGGQDTVALRCPGHPVARACLAALAALSGDPSRGVAAPSANRFGRVSPTSAADVLAELGDRLDPARDLVVDGGPSAVGVESTIVDCTAVRPRVLRLGAISQADVDEVLERAGLLRADPVEAPGSPGSVDAPGSAHGSAPSGSGSSTASTSTPAEAATPGAATTEVATTEVATVRAPGTFESHYAPAARVLLVEPETVPHAHDRFGLSTRGGAQPERMITGPVGTPGAGGTAAGGPIGLIAQVDVPTPDGWTRLSAPATAAEYAHVLYAALRRADQLGLTTVVAVLPAPEEGPLAWAVRDRLARAAHGG